MRPKIYKFCWMDRKGRESIKRSCADLSEILNDRLVSNTVHYYVEYVLVFHIQYVL